MERLIEQGRVEGLEKGLEKGRSEGRADVLVRLLGLKFGPLADADEARVRAASAEQLDVWTDRVLTAGTLQEVLT